VAYIVSISATFKFSGHFSYCMIRVNRFRHSDLDSSRL